MDIEKHNANLFRLIEENGFTLIGVFDPEGKEPTFVYTIGMTAWDMPEVLFIGNINPAFIEMILTDLVTGWLDAGKVKMGDNPDLIKFKDGSSHAVRVVDIPTDVALEKYGCQVTNFFLKDEINFVQALWPDTEGKFPDEEDYIVRMTQPIVGR